MLFIGKACQNNNSISKYILKVFRESRSFLNDDNKKETIEYSAREVKLLNSLLEERAAEDIEKVIQWSRKQAFWCSRLGSIEKLVDHFSEAWLEYTIFKQKDLGLIKQDNKKWAFEKLGAIEGVCFQESRVLLCNQYVEVGNGVHQPSIVEYDDKFFQSKVAEALKRWRIPFG